MESPFSSNTSYQTAKLKSETSTRFLTISTPVLKPIYITLFNNVLKKCKYRYNCKFLNVKKNTTYKNRINRRRPHQGNVVAYVIGHNFLKTYPTIWGTKYTLLLMFTSRVGHKILSATNVHATKLETELQLSIYETYMRRDVSLVFPCSSPG